MKNKMFATIGGAIAALCPWVTHAETFPSDGTMLENKTYESAATYDNLGTYEGTVSATAEYADILYQVGAGQYLPAGSEGVGSACTAGNYCPGLAGVTYNATNNQGLNACPNGYPMSESGASVNTQCYTTCTDASVIPHATAVAGNDYYGNGVDTCYATACDNGYHIYNGIEIIEHDPLVAGADPYVQASTWGYISAAGGDHKFQERNFGLTENGTWAAEFGYGTVYGQASCQSVASDGLDAMQSYSGMLMGVNVYTADEVRAELLETLDAANANAIADVFVDLFVECKAGTKTAEDAYKAVYAILLTEYDANFSKTDSGRHCYCQMTDFAPTGGVKGTVTKAPWVYEDTYSSVASCANYCASRCGENTAYSYTEGSIGFHAAVLGSLGVKTVGVCAANEISITWADADPADVAANNAGVCTYDGDIRTPAKAITKPGKTFKGWRFSKKN